MGFFDEIIKNAVKEVISEMAQPDPTPTPDTKPDPTLTPDTKPDPTPTSDTKPDPTPTSDTKPDPNIEMDLKGDLKELISALKDSRSVQTEKTPEAAIAAIVGLEEVK